MVNVLDATLTITAYYLKSRPSPFKERREGVERELRVTNGAILF